MPRNEKSEREKPEKPGEFASLLQEIFSDPDVERAVSKVAGRVFARVGAALASPVPAPVTPAPALAPEVLAAYKTLGVMPEAAPEVVEAAYRALAKKHHPDVGGDPLRMAEVNKAHATIKATQRQAGARYTAHT